MKTILLCIAVCLASALSAQKTTIQYFTSNIEPNQPTNGLGGTLHLILEKDSFWLILAYNKEQYHGITWGRVTSKKAARWVHLSDNLAEQRYYLRVEERMEESLADSLFVVQHDVYTDDRNVLLQYLRWDIQQQQDTLIGVQENLRGSVPLTFTQSDTFLRPVRTLAFNKDRYDENATPIRYYSLKSPTTNWLRIYWGVLICEHYFRASLSPLRKTKKGLYCEEFSYDNRYAVSLVVMRGTTNWHLDRFCVSPLLFSRKPAAEIPMILLEKARKQRKETEGY